MIRLAIPNKGRLQQPTLDLMRTAGLSFETTDRALSVMARNADIELLFVRTEDVPELVNDGVAELGITGQDLLAEYGIDLEVLAELAYGHCRLAAAVPTGSTVEKVEDLAGLRVATAHPRATARFFDERGIEVTVVPLRGSVEVATKLGVADGIVDLVSTGSTLMVNGLREVGLVLASQAVLVAGPATGNGDASRVATALQGGGGGPGQALFAPQRPGWRGRFDRHAHPGPRSADRCSTGRGGNGGNPLGGGRRRHLESAPPARGGRRDRHPRTSNRAAGSMRTVVLEELSPDERQALLLRDRLCRTRTSAPRPPTSAAMSRLAGRMQSKITPERSAVAFVASRTPRSRTPSLPFPSS